jgi:4'-phosphopantetheinyl transferase
LSNSTQKANGTDAGATPSFAPLGPDAVHVWSVAAETQSAVVDRLELLLNGEERARAGQFRFEQDRKQFVLTRGLLRKLLALYLERDAAGLEFVYSEHGKPSLQNSPNDVRFNLSHSAGRSLFAFTRGHEVGVDIEFMRSDIEFERLSDMFFSETERNTLRSLEADTRREAFYRCWTCKEAYIKARGEGLSLPLEDFDVAIEGDRAELQATRPDPREAAKWFMQRLDVGQGYAAALAVEGQGWSASPVQVSDAGDILAS